MIELSEIADKLLEVFENFKDTFTSNKKNSIAVIAILLVMTVSAIVIVTMTVGKKDIKIPQAETERELNNDQPLLFPPSPVVPDGYVYSRERKGRWTEEDAKAWFTEPTQSAIDELSVANDRLATEITGAAP